MIKSKLVIGSRGSELALWQSNWAKNEMQKLYPEIDIEIRTIKTQGDKILDVSLSKIGDKGLFTKEIEMALQDGAIDLAVHSLKDLPTVLPDGLEIGALSERIEQRDVFVSNQYATLDDVPNGSKIGTGSLRRKSQLLNYRPDLEIIDLRGNIATRIKKLADSDWSGVILAYAGLSRLGLERYIKQIMPAEIMLPAVSQGVMAVEIRSSDIETKNLVKGINSEKSEIEIRAERSFLKSLQGGCQVPIGILTNLSGSSIAMQGMVGSLDGKVVIRDYHEGKKDDPEGSGRDLAEKLIDKGAAEILETIRNVEGVSD